MSTETDLLTPLSRQFFDGKLSTDDVLETTQTLQFPFADVHSREWYVGGLRVGYSDWRVNQRVQLDWAMESPTDVITLYINLQGKTTTRRILKERAFELGPHQHNLFYSPVNEGMLQSENDGLTTFMIQFSLDTFLGLSREANDGLKRFADQVVLQKPVALSPTTLYLTTGMRQAVTAIIQCPYEGGLKKLFLQAKTLELLVMQAEAASQTPPPAGGYIKTASDKERLWFARDYLTRHLASPPSLSQLAREAGINEYKLKRGFKEVFGTSVFGYLSDQRLELAKTELLENKRTAGEIAFTLGYSSLQHFSTAFKKKFRVAPSKVRA
ncbi:AraC family transcriptional regulator [Larkinella knui]|nr:AraC family transcriptional regulator [Larkinella knui]